MSLWTLHPYIHCRSSASQGFRPAFDHHWLKFWWWWWYNNSYRSPSNVAFWESLTWLCCHILTKLNQMSMSNVDIQFNISRKTRLYVINTLGFLFDWAGSYYSFDSQSNGPGDSFWMSKVAEWMHHKQQMLYRANGLLCNILKVQIRFKNKLEIMVTWYDDFVTDCMVYGA